MRILCVDDNVAILSLLEKMLPTVLGAEVVAAQTAGQAVHVLNGGFVPDLMLLDYMMPGHSGVELCAGVKKNPDFSKTCVVIHSAVGSSIKRAALNAGAYGVVNKPMKMVELANELVALHKQFAAGLPSPLIEDLNKPATPAPRSSGGRPAAGPGSR